MSAVWLFVVPVGIVALLFVLKAVRNVSRSMGMLAQSMQELREVGLGLNQLRDQLAAMQAQPPRDDVPPQ